MRGWPRHSPRPVAGLWGWPDTALRVVAGLCGDGLDAALDSWRGYAGMAETQP